MIAFDGWHYDRLADVKGTRHSWLPVEYVVWHHGEDGEPFIDAYCPTELEASTIAHLLNLAQTVRADKAIAERARSVRKVTGERRTAFRNVEPMQIVRTPDGDTDHVFDLLDFVLGEVKK